MGNSVFIKNDPPDLEYDAEKISKKIVISAKNILEILWEDENIQLSECIGAKITENSKNLCVIFKDSISPFLERTSKNDEKIELQFKYLNIPNLNVVTYTSKGKNYQAIMIELTPASKLEMDVYKLKKEVKHLNYGYWSWLK
jgi:hypothetical protein